MSFRGIVIFLLGVDLVTSAEIQATGGENFIVSLTSQTVPGFKERLPDNYVQAEPGDSFHWAKLKKGEYRIMVSPAMESFAEMCIASIPVKLDRDVKKVSIDVPEGWAKARISFGKVRPPSQGKVKNHVFRVQRVLANGRLDPYFVQWLWTREKEGKFLGELHYIDTGTWRITAFNDTPGKDPVDVGYADVKLTKKDVAGGKVSVTIDQAVEQGSEKPSAAEKSKSDDK